MKYGLYLPPFGELADAAVLAQLAHGAEEMGFEGMFIWDHVARPHRATAVAEPWVALTAMALSTSRIRIGALVTPLARRRPQQVARQSVTLDHLSNGRLVVGVGLGVDTGDELARFGEEVDPSRRADLLDEALEVLTALWSGQMVHHRGAHMVVDGVQFLPPPLQNPRIPIWVVARSARPRIMRRAARFEGLCAETSIDGLQQMLASIGVERGGLVGFDVVARGGPTEDPAPWRAAGATWWLVQCGEGATRADAEAVIAAGPPAS